MAEYYCKACGTQLKGSDKYCPKCGTRLTRETVHFVATGAAAAAAAQAVTQPEPEPKKEYHVEGLNWNLNGYPTKRRKTEAVDFNWGAKPAPRPVSRPEPEAPVRPEPEAASQPEPEIYAQPEPEISEQPEQAVYEPEISVEPKKMSVQTFEPYEPEDLAYPEAFEEQPAAAAPEAEVPQSAEEIIAEVPAAPGSTSAADRSTIWNTGVILDALLKAGIATPQEVEELKQESQDRAAGIAPQSAGEFESPAVSALEAAKENAYNAPVIDAYYGGDIQTPEEDDFNFDIDVDLSDPTFSSKYTSRYPKPEEFFAPAQDGAAVVTDVQGADLEAADQVAEAPADDIDTQEPPADFAAPGYAFEDNLKDDIEAGIGELPKTLDMKEAQLERAFQRDIEAEFAPRPKFWADQVEDAVEEEAAKNAPEPPKYPNVTEELEEYVPMTEDAQEVPEGTAFEAASGFSYISDTEKAPETAEAPLSEVEELARLDAEIKASEAELERITTEFDPGAYAAELRKEAAAAPEAAEELSASMPEMPETPEVPKNDFIGFSTQSVRTEASEAPAEEFIGFGTSAPAETTAEKPAEDEFIGFSTGAFKTPAPETENDLFAAPAAEPVSAVSSFGDSDRIETTADLEAAIAGDSAQASSGQTATQQRQTENIDKFYTYSKKNEEFQMLLDQEYRRMRGEELPTDTITDLNKQSVKSVEVQGGGTSRFGRDGSGSRDQSRSGRRSKGRNVEPGRSMPRHTKRIDLEEIFKEEEDDKPKKHTALKVIAIIILILIIFEILFLCLRHFAPDAPITQWIESLYDKLFSGLSNLFRR